MFPTSITLFTITIASLIPFMAKAFSSANPYTSKELNSKQVCEKLSMHSMGQSLVPANAEQMQDMSRQPKDIVIVGPAALKRLAENTNYMI